MSNIPPHQQTARERQARYARRDQSPIPLNRQEQAERRHHAIVGLWQHVFFWGPSVIALALQLIFSGAWIAAIVVFLMRAAALVVGGLLTAVANNLFSAGHRTWMVINMAASMAAGAMVVVLTYQGVLSSGVPISEMWLAGAGAFALAFWPAMYSALRSSMPTDYERMIWAAQHAKPSRIIE